MELIFFLLLYGFIGFVVGTLMEVSILVDVFGYRTCEDVINHYKERPRKYDDYVSIFMFGVVWPISIFILFINIIGMKLDNRRERARKPKQTSKLTNFIICLFMPFFKR